MTTAQRKAEAWERGQALRAEFAARVEAQDPADPLTHDPMWNPKHPDYTQDPDTVEDNDAAVETPRARRSTQTRVVSPKSVDYLRTLIEQAEKRLSEPSLLDLVRAALRSESQSEVSQAIDELKKRLAQTGHRVNKFAGPCETCGGTVEAEAGILKKNGRWLVYHGADPSDCPPATDHKQTPSESVSDDLSRRTDDTDRLDLSGLPSGRYAVPGSDTRLKLKIDNLKLDKPRNPRWTGFIFVKDAAEYSQGKRYGTQRPGQTYTGDVQDELRTILEDPTAALAAYGQLTGHCGVCGRKLEDETSVALGIGPVCRKGL